MGQAGGHEGEPAALEHLLLVADSHLEASGEDVERLLLLVVDVQRRPTVRRDLDDEVVEGAARVVAGDLEDEVAARGRTAASGRRRGRGTWDGGWSASRVTSSI